MKQIDQASLGLSREYLINGLEEPFVKAYHDYQVNLAVEFGAERAFAEVEMRQALDFEIELAEVITRFNFQKYVFVSNLS